MQDNLKKYIDYRCEQAFGKIKRINVNWLYGFSDFLIKHNVDEKLTRETIEMMLSKENLENMSSAYENFNDTYYYKGNEKNFFNYLELIDSELTPEYFEEALNYVRYNCKESNVIDAFTKYLVVTRFKDVMVDSNIEKMKQDPSEIYTSYCCLGDFKLCRVNTEVWNEETIFFDELHTRKNLTGTKIGSVLLKKVLGDIHKIFPEKDVWSCRVLKTNVGAQRFYERMGGEFTESATGEIVSMESIDSTKKGENIGVIFKKEKLEKISNMEIEKPTLNKDLKTTNDKKNKNIR